MVFEIIITFTVLILLLKAFTTSVETPSQNNTWDI